MISPIGRHILASDGSDVRLRVSFLRLLEFENLKRDRVVEKKLRSES